VRRLLAAGLFVLGWLASAAAWEIEQFDAIIRVQPDSSLEITERIVADFRDDPHHGIFRTVPVYYRDKYGNALALRLQVVSVTDGTGQHHNFVESSTGRYHKLKIGDAGTLVTGLVSYSITYRVDRAVTFFDDHDELYWNATGNEWPVAIRHTSTTVVLPRAASRPINGLAFTGVNGATTGNTDIEAATDHVQYQARNTLRPLEGLTIVAGWDKGLVMPPTFNQRARWFLEDNWPLGLPLLTTVALYFWWWLFGRDPRGRGTVVVQYEPPGKLTPAEIGTVLDERCEMRDISATIVDLAARGYLHIKEISHEGILWDSTDYQFVKLREYRNDPDLLPHEKAVLRGIFNGDSFMSLSNLQGTFYTELPIIRDAVYESVVRQGFFPQSPQNVRTMYRVIGAFIAAAGLVAALLQFANPTYSWSVAGALGAAASGIVIVLFAPILPRKTPAGARLHEDILGFEEYLKRAEKQELELAEQQKLFERLLPYAMALGVAHLWGKRFESLKLRPPAWFQSDCGGQFLATMYASRLSRAGDSFARSLGVAPRGSGGSRWSGSGSGFGGGFSGGGAGGGGGGAW